MKALVISHMFPRHADDWDGIFVYEQVLALRKAGIDARVIVGNGEGCRVGFNRSTWRHFCSPRSLGSAPEWQELNGVPVMYFRYSAPYLEYWGRLGAACYVRAVRQLASWIRETFPYDLVHAHTAWLDGSAGLWLARHVGVPLVVTEHTGPFSGLTTQPSMRWVTQRAINKADRVISVSEALKRDILHHIKVDRPETIEIIGNGFRRDLFFLSDEEPSRNGTIRALWVGGYHPVKQPLRLIDAFHAAWQRESHLRLSMVGAGPLEAQVRDYVKSHDLESIITLYPAAPRQTIASYLRQHHFLVVGSETETFSIIVVEALACGRPVLSTRCGGPEETVRDNRFGELVENSMEGLIAGFLSMATRLREFDPYSLHAYAAENYSSDVIAAKVINVYKYVRTRKSEHGNISCKVSQIS